jgi:D-alanyl-D-alanine carboxypeptidase/D-alanyl-D-alanine-endopeptidase (penicillin-binding protein 4)
MLYTSKIIGKIRVLIFSVLLLLMLSPPMVQAKDAQEKPSLAQRIESILKLEKANGGTWAVEVAALDTGETLCDMNSRRAMLAASNMKLFTTAAALHFLGPDFKMKTSFYFTAKPDAKGTLDGDIIIYGRGDPNISARFQDSPTSIFEDIARELKARGLRKVTGDIIGDDSFFDAQYYGPWLPGEKHKWYAARVSALSFNDNCIDVYVRPGRAPGAKASVQYLPKTTYARVVKKVSTSSRKGDAPWLSPLNGGRNVLVGGKIWTGKGVEELWYPVESPPLYAATVFREVLELEGIKVVGKARAIGPDHKTAVPSGAEPAYEHVSLPLSEMIKVVNKRSQNLHAELLLKHIGLKTGHGPSFKGGLRAIRDFLKEVGLEEDSLRFMDGSGLSRDNRASAYSIVRLLKYMAESEHAECFSDSLAISGVDKSLRGMNWIAPEGKIHAKTGWLKNTLALSGYVDGKTRRLAFSIIVNDYTADTARIRRARDRICAEIAKY